MLDQDTGTFIASTSFQIAGTAPFSFVIVQKYICKSCNGAESYITPTDYEYPDSTEYANSVYQALSPPHSKEHGNETSNTL